MDSARSSGDATANPNDSNNFGPPFPSKMMGNKWFQKAYDTALDFYAKDSALQQRDRWELYERFERIANYQKFAGFSTFGLIVFGPYLAKYMKTGGFKNVRLPRNLLVGIFASVIAQRVTIRYKYSNEIDQLKYQTVSQQNWDSTNNFQTNSLTRQLGMMEQLQNSPPKMWSNYFKATFNNPSRRFPDPRERLQKMLENPNRPTGASFLNQRDPFSLYSGARHDSHLPKPEPLQPNYSDSGDLRNPVQTSYDPFMTSSNDNNTLDSNFKNDTKPGDFQRNRDGISQRALQNSRAQDPLIRPQQGSSWEKVRNGMWNKPDASQQDEKDLFDTSSILDIDYSNDKK
ncbi:hypothetical protein TBLA_0F01900 [Henningerozyma blattae CBS 6284]|uniref:Uncharacterized protein n=1 Tax=Henningerozyma blattae (strain ATCC 34711 / CBS 6284 / DSM 70876 / NBRC 10599 / NRRL Y-10934 / UCD 77-7) TaxID=1071380 RepID=I2H5T0_HENB6|nr:hypothetical protein TBLA_0F01900 [Tetrapisispora blattae CBS 6284]CCH61732.1 hypothetical protein TBLA_0F01900 [Tetrapisispora blattae CBS 6284]